MTNKSIFSGVKIVDFGWIGVGPQVITALACYGATVVRVESRKRPEMLRTSPPFAGGIADVDRSGFFAFYNAGKYDIALDLKNPKGMKVARKLCDWADVVSNGFTAGAFERLGLGYDDLIKTNPDVILYRTCNQGMTGPHAEQAGFGSQLVSLCGFTHYTGWPDHEPVQPFGAYTDTLAVPMGIASVAGALAYKLRTGKGQLLDFSQYEASEHFLTQHLLDSSVNGREGGRHGNSDPDAAPHEAYRCAGDDRWCAIAVFTEAEWQAFCKVIGSPSWTRLPKFAKLADRQKNEAELNRLVEAWTKDKKAEDVMEMMQKAGVAAGVVNNSADEWREPWNQFGGYKVIKHPYLGDFPHYVPEFTLSKCPLQADMPSPCLGEHTEYICKEMLGMSDDEFMEMLIDGVFT